MARMVVSSYPRAPNISSAVSKIKDRVCSPLLTASPVSLLNAGLCNVFLGNGNHPPSVGLNNSLNLNRRLDTLTTKRRASGINSGELKRIAQPRYSRNAHKHITQPFAP